MAQQVCVSVSIPFLDSSDQELVLDPGLTLLSQTERKVRPTPAHSIPRFHPSNAGSGVPPLQLCSSVAMKPRDYLSMKTEMIKVNGIVV